jgi:hypothetical protein
MPEEHGVQAPLGYEAEPISIERDGSRVRQDPRQSAVRDLELVEKAGDDCARVHVSRET